MQAVEPTIFAFKIHRSYLIPKTMIEPSHDLEDSYVYVEGQDDHHLTEQTGFTETLLLQDDSPESSRSLPYFLILTCGGAG